MVPPSAAPAQQTLPPVQSEGIEHSFEIPVHWPTATQEADGGTARVVQQVCPDGHVPGVPPPIMESRPHLASIPKGFPASGAGFMALASSPPGAALVGAGDDELHAAAAKPRTMNAPREDRTRAMVFLRGSGGAVCQRRRCFYPWR